MERIISDKYGCQIIKRYGKIIIRYDSGQSSSKIVESEITSEEAEKASLSEKDAYEVILSAQKREKLK